ncbi:MAG: glutamine--fructose-6-phosphate transaminase (isomerizing) [Acidobacteria bacterium]|nr:glutamine--fructose-6-phosphate transaminase (isomerizing) [Acidobacteriota bacterium]
MCGIVGYIGDKKVSEVIIEGLRRLEYRGYDSAGIAVVDRDGTLSMQRSAGKLTRLCEKLEKNPIDHGTYGLGHTRWATHGRPTEENAHPHTDNDGKIVVIHNGIIENYLELKKEMESKGHLFKTDTDTEVAAHLIGKNFDGSLIDAVRISIPMLRGHYAFLVIAVNDPDKIVAVRNGPPIVIGLGEDENFVASDIPAILPYTRKMVFLNDGEIAEVTRKNLNIYDFNGEKIEPDVQTINWDPIQVEKGGYKHFMLKEIFEQPRAVRDTLYGRIAPEEGDVYISEINLDEEQVRKINRIIIDACGTSWHAGLVGKFYLEQLTGLPVEVDYGSELRYRDPIVNENTLGLIITQSGETADTISAMRILKEKGARLVSICNVAGSMASRQSHGVVYTHAGPEIGVASTKAFTSQLIALLLIAVHIGRRNGFLKKEEAMNILEDMMKLPHHMEIGLEHLPGKLEDIAKELSNKRDFLYLGRGLCYPIALEGALKLKEISYIHAEGYPAGEMKHGPIALIDENMPVVALAPGDKVYEKMLSNIEEVKARDGIVLALVDTNDTNLIGKADYIIELPIVPDLMKPILYTVPLQLLAYYIAVKLGADVDQPRNLAKSVTVE